MTDPRPRPAKRKPPPRVQPRKVYIATACAFMAAAGGLSAQMATGNDPALGGKAPAVAAAPPATVKRVIRTVVVTKVVKHRKPKTPSTSVATQASSGYTSQAPSYSAPASQQAAAPVQTYTPPPAPAPAPAAPATRTS